MKRKEARAQSNTRKRGAVKRKNKAARKKKREQGQHQGLRERAHERKEELQKELTYLKTVREKEVADLIKEARGFGDLSENFEYKAAKREKNRNDSRIRYLQRMVDTAKVISDHSSGDVVGLFD